MKNVIDELKASFVLTKEEIERTKLYVVKKYPNNSSKENARILSRTIYDILDKNLKGINGEQKQNIKKKIIGSTILKDKKNILKWDIFNAYIDELEENPQLKTSFLVWINQNQKNRISQESFEEYIGSIYNERYIDKLPDFYDESPRSDKVLKHNGVFWYKHKIALSLFALLILSLYSLNNFANDSSGLEDKKKNKVEQSYVTNVHEYDSYVTDKMSYHPQLPDYFNYKSVDKGELLAFLNSKNSLLAEEPYFSTIIRASKEFNLNPHILFAITGQEQSFVPKNHENADKIANNPFNVFHSWKEYNTDIYDSSKIAARTVINLSKDKPPNVDIFDWINNKYADDKGWGRGVKEIFQELDE